MEQRLFIVCSGNYNQLTRLRKKIEPVAERSGNIPATAHIQNRVRATAPQYRRIRYLGCQHGHIKRHHASALICKKFQRSLILHYHKAYVCLGNLFLQYGCKPGTPIFAVVTDKIEHFNVYIVETQTFFPEDFNCSGSHVVCNRQAVLRSGENEHGLVLSCLRLGHLPCWLHALRIGRSCACRESEKTDIRSQQQGAAHANQPHCSNAKDRWMMKTALRQFHSGEQ